MKRDGMASFAKVIECPKCGRVTAFGLYKGEHLRWCLYCNCSWAVFYNKSSKRYKRSKLVKGLMSDEQRYRPRTY